MLAAPRTIALLATLAGLVACSVAAPGGGTSPMPPSLPPTGTLETAVAAAKADAAGRSGVAPEAIAVDLAQAVTWRDGSLGCPQPGVMYTMALVPGWRVVLRAGGSRLDYHLSRRGQIVLCPAGRSQDPLAADR